MSGSNSLEHFFTAETHLVAAKKATVPRQRHWPVDPRTRYRVFLGARGSRRRSLHASPPSERLSPTAAGSPCAVRLSDFPPAIGGSIPSVPNGHSGYP